MEFLVEVPEILVCDCSTSVLIGVMAFAPLRCSGVSNITKSCLGHLVGGVVSFKLFQRRRGDSCNWVKYPGKFNLLHKLSIYCPKTPPDSTAPRHIIARFYLNQAESRLTSTRLEYEIFRQFPRG